MKDLVDRLEEEGSKLSAEAAEEIAKLETLLNFALEGLDSAPRSWGLKITHSDKIRKVLK